MGFFVKSMGRAPGRAISSSWTSGPTRAISSSPTTPTTMFPRTVKHKPPNILISVNGARGPKTSRTRSASCSS